MDQPTAMSASNRGALRGAVRVSWKVATGPIASAARPITSSRTRLRESLPAPHRLADPKITRRRSPSRSTFAMNPTATLEAIRSA